MNLKEIFSLVLIFLCLGSAFTLCAEADDFVLNSLTSELRAEPTHYGNCDKSSSDNYPHLCHIGHCGFIVINETKIAKLDLQEAKVSLTDVQVKTIIVSPSDKPPKKV